MLRKSSKMARQQQAAELERQREAQLLPKQPPQLPSHRPLPNMATFGGDEVRPDSVAIFNQGPYTHPRTAPSNPSQAQPAMQAANFSRPGFVAVGVSSPPSANSSSSPAYALRGASASASSSPVGAAVANGNHYDSVGERTSSMTNRGRYSFASGTGQGAHVNSPRRVRRRKDPTPFNVLVIGTKNSGKSSFISFLRQSLAVPSHKNDGEIQPQQTKGTFTSTYVETEMEGERVGLTLWDSPGLDKNIVDLQLRDMTSFIESKFEETFAEEQKVMRSPGFKDTHIHCVFFVLDPIILDATVAGNHGAKGGAVGAGVGGLNEEIDLQVLRALWGKTTVIPIISKADTLTIGHMNHLKRAVWQSIKSSNLNPLEALELEDDSPDELDDVSEVDEIADSPTFYSDPNESVIDNLLDRTSDSDSDDAPASKPTKRASHTRSVSYSTNNTAAAAAEEEPYLPMSILSPDLYDLPPYAKPNPKQKPTDLGRRFPWGLASPFNPDHCDYVRLRDSIFSEWRTDLRELSRVKWYEQWRTSRLRNAPGTKQRVKGGVTPVASVPREGRTSPKNVRNFSATSQPVSVGMAVSTPTAENGLRAAH